jgi:hypothetical protein
MKRKGCFGVSARKHPTNSAASTVLEHSFHLGAVWAQDASRQLQTTAHLPACSSTRRMSHACGAHSPTRQWADQSTPSTLYTRGTYPTGGSSGNPWLCRGAPGGVRVPPRPACCDATDPPRAHSPCPLAPPERKLYLPGARSWLGWVIERPPRVRRPLTGFRSSGARGGCAQEWSESLIPRQSSAASTGFGTGISAAAPSKRKDNDHK